MFCYVIMCALIRIVNTRNNNNYEYKVSCFRIGKFSEVIR